MNVCTWTCNAEVTHCHLVLLKPFSSLSVLPQCKIDDKLKGFFMLKSRLIQEFTYTIGSSLISWGSKDLPYFRAYKTHFFTRIFILNTGVRLIHKARNLGCFTSSAQPTQRSQIDDQPLPEPVSELSLGMISFQLCF